MGKPDGKMQEPKTAAMRTVGLNSVQDYEED